MLRHLFLIPFLFIFILFYWGCEMAQEPNTVVQSQQGVTGIDGSSGLELLSMLPGDAQIISAEFFIFVTSGVGIPVDVHRITSDWSEATVTWNNFGGSGSYKPADEGSFNSFPGWQSVDITTLVENWIFDTDNYPNYGILLKQGELLSRYHSSEYDAEPLLGPKLVIKFSHAGGAEEDEIVIQRGDISDVADAFISELVPDAKYGSTTDLFTGFVELNEKQSLIKFKLPDFPPTPGVGTGTPGYWKNHPEAWPVDEITIGGETYTKEMAIFFMKARVKKDKTFTMFPALVAAKLNVLIGNEDSCIEGTIKDADQWMADYGPVVGSGVKASSNAWEMGEPLYEVLDLYNNGKLCAPSRDAME